MLDDTDACDLLCNDLRDRIAKREVVLFVGTGVSVASSNGAPAASWKGLLESGINRCVSLRALDSAHAEHLKRQLDSSDIDLWIAAAQVVETKLKKAAGEYGLWLRDTVGSLKASKPELISALARLQVPFFTTNYDDLLEQVTGTAAITWRAGDKVERVLRGELKAVVHLHGHFDDPESVILGVSSYDNILRDASAQAMLRAVRATRTLVFIGFGQGLADPNFGAFLAWSRSVFATSHFRHFRLARKSECGALQTEHDPNERIFVVPYGEDYAELLPFLESLCSGRSVTYLPCPAAAPTPSPEEIRHFSLETFHAEIDLAAQHRKQGAPDVAIALLEKLRTRHSTAFDKRLWFRLLANLGLAYDDKEEYGKAAALYLQAKDYEPQSTDARCFEAVAYFFQNQEIKAHELAESIRRDQPRSTLAHAVWVRSCGESTNFSELEAGVPEHLRSSQDVAHALMLAALQRGEQKAAERYGRLALATEPDSPLLLEHLGIVLLEKARDILRDIQAEIAPREARMFADEAIVLVKKSLAGRKGRESITTRARLYSALATAYEIIENDADTERHTRLAFDLDSGNPRIVFQLAGNLAKRKEFTGAIALMTAQMGGNLDAGQELILATLYRARNAQTDLNSATMLLQSLASRLASLPLAQQCECITKLLAVYVECNAHGDAEAFLSTLGESTAPAIAAAAKAGYLRQSGDVEQAKAIALHAYATVQASDTFTTRQFLARELTALKLYREAMVLWKILVRPEYMSRDVRLAVMAAQHADDPTFLLDFCASLRSNGLYDEHCISAELRVLGRYNCVDSALAIGQECILHVGDDRFRKHLGVNMALLGLELGSDNIWTLTPAELPPAGEASPGLGLAVTQILSHTQAPLRAVEYAYELLRKRFASREANIAMITSMLFSERRQLLIATPTEAGPGVAVAYRETEESGVKWWIIEELAGPRRSRRELSPSHPLAKEMSGKQIGDVITIRDGTLQSRQARIVELKSKFVYRFQECLHEFEEYFLGKPFLMQFSVTRPDSDEPDFSPLFRSIEQRCAAISQIDKQYRKLLPSMNSYAMQTSSHTCDAAGHLISAQLPIRCCRGTGAELNAAEQHLNQAEAIVVDGSALATLFLAGAIGMVKDLGVRIVISYGTWRALRHLYSERENNAGEGWFGKSGDRFVFREHSQEERLKSFEDMRRFVETVKSSATIEEGRAFASVAKRERDLIVKGFGRACGESMALAQRDGHVLWLTDVRIRNVDDWVVEWHRQKAKRQGRSLEGELRDILTQVATERKLAIAAEMRSGLDELRAKHGLFPDSASAIREDRERRG